MSAKAVSDSYAHNNFLEQLDDDTLTFGYLTTAISTTVNVTFMSDVNHAGQLNEAMVESRGFSIRPLYWCSGITYPSLPAGLLLR